MTRLARLAVAVVVAAWCGVASAQSTRPAVPPPATGPAATVPVGTPEVVAPGPLSERVRRELSAALRSALAGGENARPTTRPTSPAASEPTAGVAAPAAEPVVREGEPGAGEAAAGMPPRAEPAPGDARLPAGADVAGGSDPRPGTDLPADPSNPRQMIPVDDPVVPLNPAQTDEPAMIAGEPAAGPNDADVRRADPVGVAPGAEDRPEGDPLLPDVPDDAADINAGGPATGTVTNAVKQAATADDGVPESPGEGPRNVGGDGVTPAIVEAEPDAPFLGDAGWALALMWAAAIGLPVVLTICLFLFGKGS